MSGDLIAILVFVMPGLVGAGTYRLLTVNRKMGQFDFTVFSFVLTIATLIFAWLFEGLAKWSCNWNLKILPIEELVNAFNSENSVNSVNSVNSENSVQPKFYSVLINYLFSVGFIFINLIGIVLGLLLSLGINSGKFFKLFRKMGFTRKSGRVDPWQDFFNHRMLEEDTWVLIIFKDDRRYYGRLKNFSDDPEFREIIIADVKQLVQNNTTGEYIESPINEELIYIMVAEIEQIRLVRNQPDTPNEERA